MKRIALMTTTQKKQDFKTSGATKAGRSVRTADFDLVKYFSLTCLSLFIVVTSVMCSGFYHISKRFIRHDAEQRAIPIAERLASLTFVDGKPIPAPNTPAFRLMDQRLREVLEPLAIFKIKVYEPGDRITYCTDSNVRPGRVDSQNSKLAKAVSGETVSVLQTNETVWDLHEEEKRRGTIVETYVPIWAKSPADTLVGVFEIYQDVSVTYDRLPGLVALIVGASLLSMGLLFYFLFLVIRKASLIIQDQTCAIERAKTAIEKNVTELERRVVERTQQLKESLAQQGQDEKMVATGTLAAGVAHELNTPLGTILGSTQMILDHCRPCEEVGGDESTPPATRSGNVPLCYDDLNRIESQARRCKEIIRNLVDFSRKSDSERAWENMRELIESSVLLVQPEARRIGVKLETDCEARVPRLMVNGNEIQQVLVNIMNNGIAAMPDGGVLGVRGYRVGKEIRIEIRDTGVGIDEAVLMRIFEPFFTTKDVGKGTGLGLSISYRIIKDHGGSIRVDSEVGKGSTFEIGLPIDSRRAPEKQFCEIST